MTEQRFFFIWLCLPSPSSLFGTYLKTTPKFPSCFFSCVNQGSSSMRGFVQLQKAVLDSYSASETKLQTRCLGLSATCGPTARDTEYISSEWDQCRFMINMNATWHFLLSLYDNIAMPPTQDLLPSAAWQPHRSQPYNVSMCGDCTQKQIGRKNRNYIFESKQNTKAFESV